MILFVNVYNSNFKALFSFKLVAFAVGCVILSFLLLVAFIPKIERRNCRRSVMIQGIFRSNYVIFGVPITASIYGPENISLTAILIAFVIPLFNLLSVVALELFAPKKSDWVTIFHSVFTNPLIVASIGGFFCILTGLRFPTLVESTLTDIANIATPLALIRPEARRYGTWCRRL